MDQIETLTKLIELAKKSGITKLKCDGIEIEFGGVGTPNVATPLSDLDLPTEKMPTEDELLYLSSGYTPQVRTTESPEH